MKSKICGEVSNKLLVISQHTNNNFFLWQLYGLRRLLLSQRYPVVVAKGNIVGRVEQWGNGRRLLHEQSGDQLVVTGHRHTTAITQLDVQTFRQIIL